MAATRRSSEASLGKTLTFTVRRRLLDGSSMGFEVRMRFWWRGQGEDGEALGDRRLQPIGELGGAVAVGRHQMAQLGLGGPSAATRRSSLPMAFRMARLGA